MAMSFCPLLGYNESGLNSFTQAYFICQYGPHAQWRLKGEEGRVYLMWIQIHLSFGKYTSEFILIT